MSSHTLKLKDNQFVAAGGGFGTKSDPLQLLSSSIVEAASRGNYPGGIVVHKFGEASQFSDNDGEVTVWDGVSDTVAADLGGVIADYTYSANGVADITNVCSSDNTDLQATQIQGLDVDGNLVVQSVDLLGNTPVTLTTPLWRIFRMKNVSMSPLASDYLGNIYCMAGTNVVAGVPVVPSDVRAIVRDSHNQTQMAMYTVPLGMSLYIYLGWASINRRRNSGSANLYIYVRDYGSVFRELHKTSMLVLGNSSSTRPYTIPLKLDALTDIYYAAEASDSGMGVSAGFHAVLLPE